MNLQENIQRIREMMGIITEQNDGPWNPDYPKPTTYEFETLSPEEIEKRDSEQKMTTFNSKTITGSYTAPIVNCDRLHAFNDTKTGPVGKMNDIVNPELIKIYESGINPDITDITINIKKGNTEYTVDWSVTIDESKDGIAYVGLYSRGHGGRGKWVFDDVSTISGHASIDACKTSNFIKKRGTVKDMVLVKDFEFNKDGEIAGCQVNQLFYKYTLEEYPSHQ